MSEKEAQPISRRSFLAGSASGVAGTVVGGVTLWIDLGAPRRASAGTTAAESSVHSAHAASSGEPADTADRRRSFLPHEWKQVEAITARILPSGDSPGALEAGCVRYIDRALAEEDAAARPLYQAALGALDALCRDREGSPFDEWPAAAQDLLLHELESGAVKGWAAPEASPSAFFATVRMHTILGFVLDPKYGGNRDYAGWRTMGFPGPVHHLGGSQADQMRGERRFVPIWERGSGGTNHQGSVVAPESE